MNFKFNFFLYLFNSESVKVCNFSPKFVVCYFVIFSCLDYVEIIIIDDCERAHSKNIFCS